MFSKCLSPIFPSLLTHIAHTYLQNCSFFFHASFSSVGLKAWHPVGPVISCENNSMVLFFCRFQACVTPVFLLSPLIPQPLHSHSHGFIPLTQLSTCHSINIETSFWDQTGSHQMVIHSLELIVCSRIPSQSGQLTFAS